jgi:Holliday junction resolvase
MSRKSKGSNAERELIHMFWSTGKWAAIRVAGSGCCTNPAPDVVAGNVNRKLAIECKSTKDTKYIPKQDIEDLKTYSNLFGAEPLIGMRFDREGWFFVKVEDLVDAGGSYVISLDYLKTKGIDFNKLIE